MMKNKHKISPIIIFNLIQIFLTAVEVCSEAHFLCLGIGGEADYHVVVVASVSN